jgi:hypothetical protein
LREASLLFVVRLKVYVRRWKFLSEQSFAETSFGESLKLLANHQLGTATRSRSDISGFLPSCCPNAMLMMRAWEDAVSPEIKLTQGASKCWERLHFFVTLNLHVTEL